MSIRSKAATSPADAGFDLLTDVMEQVRLEAPVFFTADLAAPFGISVVREGRAPFYAMRSGESLLRVGDRAERKVRAGDFILLPGGAPHVVRVECTRVPQPSGDGCGAAACRVRLEWPSGPARASRGPPALPACLWSLP
jgi:hypothetical protein